MPTDDADARALLAPGPGSYVAERTRLIKQARADGDRARAGFYQSLKRPTLALWAVLAAGDDADAVRDLVAATKKLAEIQASGSDAAAMSAATKQRRQALEAAVDRALAALAQWDSAAEARRSEIRTIVDQLSRHPELADSWIDATLRDLPDDAFGFAAFDDMHVTAASPPKTSTKASGDRPAKEAPSGPTSAERAQQAREEKKAQQELAAAARELATATRRLDAARAALRNAERELRLAEDDHAVSEQRRDRLAERLS